MDFTAFEKLVKQRHSTRVFSSTPVTKERILQLLNVAHLAPSVENLQPWHFHVIMNPETRRKMMSACCYGNFVDSGGVFVIVSCDKSLQATAPDIIWNERELEYSCMGAMMQFLLGATAMGLGSCWVSLHHGQVHEILGLPRTHSIVGGIMVGHIGTGGDNAAAPPPRKSLMDMVAFYD